MGDAPEGVSDYIGLVITCTGSGPVRTLESAMGAHAKDMPVARVIALATDLIKLCRVFQRDQQLAPSGALL
jgi:hypothetical protein